MNSTSCKSDTQKTSVTMWPNQYITPAILVLCLVFADRPLVVVVVAQDQAAANLEGEVKDNSAFDAFDPFQANPAANHAPAERSKQQVNSAELITGSPDSKSKDSIRSKDLNKQSRSKVESVIDAERTLSVPPIDKSILPPDSPAWVRQAPDFAQKYHRFNVCSTPTSNMDDVDFSLDFALEYAVREYIDRRVLNQVGAAKNLPVSAKYIRQNLIDEPAGYIATSTDADGEVIQKWVQVSISPDQREQFRVWHGEVVQRRRVANLGLAVLLLVTSTGGAHLWLSQRQRRNAGANFVPANFTSETPPVVTGSRNRQRGFFHKLAIVLSCVAIWVVAVNYLRVRVPHRVSASQSTHSLKVDQYETSFDDQLHGR